MNLNRNNDGVLATTQVKQPVSFSAANMDLLYQPMHMDRSWKRGPGLINHVTFEEARYGLFLAIAYVENQATIDGSLSKTLKDVLQQIDVHNKETNWSCKGNIVVKHENQEQTATIEPASKHQDISVDSTDQQNTVYDSKPFAVLNEHTTQTDFMQLRDFDLPSRSKSFNFDKSITNQTVLGPMGKAAILNSEYPVIQHYETASGSSMRYVDELVDTCSDNQNFKLEPNDDSTDRNSNSGSVQALVIKHEKPSSGSRYDSYSTSVDIRQGYFDDKSEKEDGFCGSDAPIQRSTTVPANKYKCPHCGQTCAKASYLKRHVLIHTGEKPYNCSICDGKFGRRSSYKRHMLTCHSNNDGQICDNCGKRYATSSTLKEHILTCHTGGTNKLLEDSGKVHAASNTLNNSKQLAPPKSLMCPICGKGFGKTKGLSSHMLLHSSKKPYICRDCGKAYVKSAHLKQHMRIHNDEQLHVCPICGRGFAYASNLKPHMLTHSGDKPHNCPDCGKRFAQISNLNKHSLAHSKVKPHICNICDRGFTFPCNLRIHMLEHTGEKPHVCPECGKGFVLSGNLTQHMTTHTGQKAHMCVECGKGFTRSTHLKQHMFIFHTGSRTGETSYRHTFADDDT